jgi:hypothetical protein
LNRDKLFNEVEDVTILPIWNKIRSRQPSDVA